MGLNDAIAFLGLVVVSKRAKQARCRWFACASQTYYSIPYLPNLIDGSLSIQSTVGQGGVIVLKLAQASSHTKPHHIRSRKKTFRPGDGDG